MKVETMNDWTYKSTRHSVTTDQTYTSPSKCQEVIREFIKRPENSHMKVWEFRIYQVR